LQEKSRAGVQLGCCFLFHWYPRMVRIYCRYADCKDQRSKENHDASTITQWVIYEFHSLERILFRPALVFNPILKKKKRKIHYRADRKHPADEQKKKEQGIHIIPPIFLFQNPLCNFEKRI
jgi:hypothetical protein